MGFQFTDVCFITGDVPRLRAFYEAVFGGRAEGDAVHAALVLEGIQFTFDAVDPLQRNAAFQYVSTGGANHVIVCFTVDDVDAEYRRLLSLGVEMMNEPTTHPWGARSFQFRDPDGNLLNFRSVPKGG